MPVKQFSVFLENRPGSLAEFTKILGNYQLDLLSLSVADTTNYGILRGIVNDSEKAADIIRKNGYSFKMTDVIAVSIPDRPGSLAQVLEILSESSISVEYLYSFFAGGTDHKANIILRVDDPEKAEGLLQNSGVHLITQNEISEM